MSRELPGHAWSLSEVRRSRFLYRCRRCPAVTLNAEPLPPRWNVKCGAGLSAK